MLTFTDIAALITFVTLVVVAVRRHSNKSSRPATTPLPPANLKSGTESDVNKDRRPGGE